MIELAVTRKEINLLRQLIELERNVLNRETWLDKDAQKERQSVVANLQRKILHAWNKDTGVRLAEIENESDALSD